MAFGLQPGQLAGTVFDQAGAVIPKASVTVTNLGTGDSRKAVTDAGGNWVVSGVPSGSVEIYIHATGFTTYSQRVDYEASKPVRYQSALKIGALTETIEVVSGTGGGQVEAPSQRELRKTAAEAPMSANVTKLQQRVAGVLPIRVDVPRAGISYRFARALVIDEETKVTFSYRTEAGKTRR